MRKKRYNKRPSNKTFPTAKIDYELPVQISNFVGYPALTVLNTYLKLVSTIFYQIFNFHQIIALKKLWKMLFISSKKLWPFSSYSHFYTWPCFFRFSWFKVTHDSGIIMLWNGLHKLAKCNFWNNPKIALFCTIKLGQISQEKINQCLTNINQ